MRDTGTVVPTALAAAVLLAASAPAPPGRPQREPVLKQVRVPHPYYWREMYVPQVTSGPTHVTWSPDGTEVIYAMQGSLWRQRIDSDEAVQLTAGPGYDHQPDWSPDGRRIVYASHRDDALSLWLLDLASGHRTPLVADGHVNLDPRWSPDGTRIAFVSTAHEGRWHVFLVVPDGGAPLRITEDHASGLPRYYYSGWDHYLSPTWSPDGRELIVVGNRGRVSGTGGLWRMAAEPGAAMREIHYEETTWKARPDWAPDGRRVVYSSYHGRQWNQLWTVPAAGGDPLPLTYGEHDLTAPRWSRDGRRLAAISNQGGIPALVVIEVPGGRARRVEPRVRRYRAPMARLELTVDGGGGQPMPARLSVTAADGRGYAPDDAWRHADEAFVRGEQAFEQTYFHSRGRSTVTVPAGDVVVTAWRGPEYATARQELRLAAGEAREVRLPLARLDDPSARGWWAGDLHVHMNYGGHYRNTPEHLAFQGQAEGLHLVENLVVNKEQRIPDIAAFRTTPDPVSTERFLLVHGQEFHTGFWGHLGLLGLRDHFLLPDYAGYPGSAAASLLPTNADVADLAHAQGALVGYVHPFDTAPDPDNASERLSYALPVDAALGKLDYLEVMGYSDHLITSSVWYRLLNCGFRIAAGAGTDAFPNFASLRGPAGLLRTYVQAGTRLDHAAFLEGLRHGRTFVTNAPLLTFEVEGQGPGGEIALTAGRPLRARVALRSPVPVDHLEVVASGKVVATVALTGDGTAAEATVSLPAERSGWYVLRAWADRPRLPVLDLYPFASTSPVYVTIGGQPVRSPDDAAWFVRWVDRVAAVAAAHEGWNTPAERQAALAQLARARDEYVRRSSRN
jgi:Tol biopolymer transport system component